LVIPSFRLKFQSITMGRGVEGVRPASLIETKYWAIEDPRDKAIEEVRRIRDELRARVIDLLKEIQNTRRKEIENDYYTRVDI